MSIINSAITCQILAVVLDHNQHDSTIMFIDCQVQSELFRGFLLW
jgi:hypothetical protein